jgi:hypothetical protein
VIRRRVFTFASAVSLLLCVTTGLAWVESYRYWFELLHSSSTGWKEETSSIKQPAVRSWSRYELTALPGFVFLKRDVAFGDKSARSDTSNPDQAAAWRIQSSLIVPGKAAWDRRRAVDGTIFKLAHPWRRLGFGFANELPSHDGTGPATGPFAAFVASTDQTDEVHQEFLAPFWAFIVLFAALPAIWTLFALGRRWHLVRRSRLHRPADASDRGTVRHRTLPRRLFTAASAVSLLLLLATIITWRGSYRYSFNLERNILRTWDGQLVPFSISKDSPVGKWTRYELQARPGFIFLRRHVVDAKPPYRMDPNPEETVGLDIQSELMRLDEMPSYQSSIRDGSIFWLSNPWRHAGFGFVSFRDPKYNSDHTYTIQQEFLAPFWPLALLFAALPLAWAVATIRRRRRMTSHLCATCAYNLTGNASGVCPECGTAIPPLPGAKERAPLRFLRADDHRMVSRPSYL